MDALPFTKMHGCRNDYVVLDATRVGKDDPSALARVLCDRRAGVGADGLLVVSGPEHDADFRMRMFNIDGSEAEMCGNGLRCAAWYAVDTGLCGPGPLRAHTGAGVLPVEVDHAGRRASVDMGAPALPDGDPVESLDAGGTVVRFTPIGMGNPHAVIFVKDVTTAPVESLGPAIETHARFPDRTNVEFVEVLDHAHVRQRTWERGCGETEACGTGACAVVVAGALVGHTGRAVRVDLRGGTLDVEWTPEGVVRQSGPIAVAFEGAWRGDA